MYVYIYASIFYIYLLNFQCRQLVFDEYRMKLYYQSTRRLENVIQLFYKKYISRYILYSVSWIKNLRSFIKIMIDKSRVSLYTQSHT